MLYTVQQGSYFTLKGCFGINNKLNSSRWIIIYKSNLSLLPEKLPRLNHETVVSVDLRPLELSGQVLWSRTRLECVLLHEVWFKHFLEGEMRYIYQQFRNEEFSVIKCVLILLWF